MYLGEGIAKRATLNTLNLDLTFNNIGEIGAKYLREGIAKCVTLTSLKLDLKYNNISKNGHKRLK